MFGSFESALYLALLAFVFFVASMSSTAVPVGTRRVFALLGAVTAFVSLFAYLSAVA